MIVDANNLPDDGTLRADVCIVGAGAAGISMALQFLGSGIEVLLLESGAVGEEPDTQALYVGTVADERLHSPPDRYRQRRFGGTTTTWGGRCIPFDPIDFEARDYVPHSGWPLAREALLPYYPPANRLCEAGDFSYTAATSFRDVGRPMIAGFDSVYFSSDTLERFSCPTDFGARYGHQLRSAPNITVVMHANVTAIRLQAGGERVASLDVRSLGGKRLQAHAAHFVLAAGGLEVARLLLASRDVQADGIGNQHDVVGRYYMCHLAGTIGALKILKPPEAVHHGYEISEDGIYCRRRLALRPEVQRAQRLGNFIARLHHPRITDPAHRSSVLSLLYLAKPFIPYEYSKRLHGDEHASVRAWLQHLGNVVAGPFEAVTFAWHMLRDRKLAERKFPSIIVTSKKNLYSIDFHAEQQPDASSRVMLDSAQDALGMPRLRIDWRYTAGDVDTVQRAIALLAAEFARTGVGRLDYEPETVEAEMTRYGAYGGHHIGTARMGSDPRGSVVDGNCRVHGVGNLFVASAATFPTSSQANPTLTVVALSLRLAAHLRWLVRADGAAAAITEPSQPSSMRSAHRFQFPGMTTRVLVLGADGFIGSHLVGSLAASDWASPIACGRRTRAARAADPIARLQFDATDESALNHALQSADAVVNCIAGSAQTIANGARALMAAAARQSRPPRVVHLSSMAVYGTVTGVVAESAPLRGEDAYAQAKIAAEADCGHYSQAVLLRPGIVYGPRSRQWTERVARWLLAHRLGDLGAAGDGCCNLVYVEDVVVAITQCLRLPGVAGQVFNLAMAQPPTWNEYFVGFARALGAVPVARIGRRRLKIETTLLAPPLKIAEILCRKAGITALRLPEAIPPSLLRLCQQDIRLDVARAEQLLQLRWTALDDGLRQAARWFNQRAQ